MVLATDMSCHFQQVKAMKNFLQQPEGSVSSLPSPQLYNPFSTGHPAPDVHILINPVSSPALPIHHPLFTVKLTLPCRVRREFLFKSQKIVFRGMMIGVTLLFFFFPSKLCFIAKWYQTSCIMQHRWTERYQFKPSQTQRRDSLDFRAGTVFMLQSHARLAGWNLFTRCDDKTFAFRNVCWHAESCCSGADRLKKAF